MASFDDNGWPYLIDYAGLLDDIDVAASSAAPPDLYWNYQLPQSQSASVENASFSVGTSHVIECAEKECSRKRDRNNTCGGIATKAFRERMRRGKLNDKFTELSAILEPGRPPKTDKLAIMNDAILEPGRPPKTDKLAIMIDAIRTLNQLKAESQEYKETNQRLMEEIRNLKEEKNELRQEKLMLKADKEWIEPQLKVKSVPPTGFMPATMPPPMYLPEVNKVPVFPSYGIVPMWQYITPSARDTSRDHMLRPPAA